MMTAITMVAICAIVRQKAAASSSGAGLRAPIWNGRDPHFHDEGFGSTVNGHVLRQARGRGGGAGARSNGKGRDLVPGLYRDPCDARIRAAR
jgi:hypothetical protein